MFLLTVRFMETSIHQIKKPFNLGHRLHFLNLKFHYFFSSCSGSEQAVPLIAPLKEGGIILGISMKMAADDDSMMIR
jgi:hypothetical protein